MTHRAILCDIYKTLLEVGPPPPEAEVRWSELVAAVCRTGARPSLAQFSDSAERAIRLEHATARAGGVAHPEVFWPFIACEALPALVALDPGALDDFLFEHAQLQRSVRLMPGAAEVLKSLSAGEVLLGLVSNSQPYTLRELDGALRAAGLSSSLFQPDLRFLSFEHGFSKPDPHVFRFLTARLAQRGIRPGEALVVGDRQDNDVAPARGAGFKTWLLSAAASGEDQGGWPSLGAKLGRD